MSNKKSNNFSKLFVYFNEEEEDSEVEIMNYQDNYNKMVQAKNSNEIISNQNNNNNNSNKKEEDEKDNSIINELYSDKEKDEEEDNDVFYYKEKKINEGKEDENNFNNFNNFKFTSFKPKIKDSTEKNEENERNNEYIDNKSENDELNNKKENESNKNFKNEEIHQKIMTGQNSFENINDTLNRSTSLQTEKIGENSQIKNNQENKIKEEYKPEYLINSKIFDELENKTNKKRNKIEWKDRNVLIKRNVEQLKIYMKKNTKMKVNNDKKPIELILYDDAMKKKQKEEIINKNLISENRLNSNRSKINKISYKIAMQKDDKKIESVIKKYSSNYELTLIDICLILQELKIFLKLLQNINVNKLVNTTDINEFKNRISIVIKDNEIRKKKELEFLEQIWNLLSIQRNCINNDIFEGFLKILFSSLGNINETYNVMKQYIRVAYFGEKVQNNLNNKIKECLNNFFILKQNIIAYKNINDRNNAKYKKIIKENEKNFTFTPNIEKNKDYNSNMVQHRKNFNFNTLYERFIKKEKDKQNNLNKLIKERKKEEMKEVKKKPIISKYINNNLYQEHQEEIHEKLYNQGNYIRKKKQNRIEEKKKEEKEKFEKEMKTYKLNYNSKRNRRRMAKSFDIPSRPKGYDEYIIRNRKEILNKEKLKQIKDKIPCGENYEKIKRRTITPFNITDMKRKRTKEKNNDYFTMKIKIPNGQMKNLKIYIKSDPYKIANDFCKIYSVKDDVKRKLIKNIINCQNVYLKVKNGDVNFFDNSL